MQPKKKQRKWLSSSHEYSPRQEKDLAKRLGGRVTRGSGSGNDKGDVAVKGKYRIECKCTKNKSYSLKREVIEKIEEEALNCGETPIMNIHFINEFGKKLNGVYVIPEEFLDID